MIGANRSGALLTLEERKSLYAVIVRLSGKHAQPLADAAVHSMKDIADKVHTFTFDNGLEFAQYGQIAQQLDAKIYFAHPYCSWERGSNESTNGLIRQYFPKGTDFNTVTDAQVKFVMDRLNNRSRKSRGGKSPKEIFTGQLVELLVA